MPQHGRTVIDINVGRYGDIVRKSSCTQLLPGIASFKRLEEVVARATISGHRCLCLRGKVAAQVRHDGSCSQPILQRETEAPILWPLFTRRNHRNAPTATHGRFGHGPTVA
jgi:hypothetical protein